MKFQAIFVILTAVMMNSSLETQARASSEPTTVVLGDVEGQWGRLNSFFKNSHAFEFTDSGVVTLKPGYRFVFMGDAIDKGDSSLRILSVLTELKKASPDQVVLILGNRDINKLRLIDEISDLGLQRPPNETTATQTFAGWMAEKKIAPQLFNDRATRLKWILEKTMGSPQAFEFRRVELVREAHHQTVSDEQVAISFLNDLDPQSGLVARYLQRAQLAFFDKPHRTLFVHGGLTPESLGAIPGMAEKIADVDQWTKNLNAWAKSEVENALARRGSGADLIRYQQPIPGTRQNQASVVYGRNFDSTSNPELIPEELQNFLLAQGIDTIVVGHTPVGEIPVVISNGKFRMVFVDNSSSTQLNSAAVSFRHHELEVSARWPTSTDPTHYRHVLGKESAVGTQIESGWVVAATADEIISMRINSAKGFVPEYRVLPRTSLTCQKIFGGGAR